MHLYKNLFANFFLSFFNVCTSHTMQVSENNLSWEEEGGKKGEMGKRWERKKGEQMGRKVGRGRQLLPV